MTAGIATRGQSGKPFVAQRPQTHPSAAALDTTPPPAARTLHRGGPARGGDRQTPHVPVPRPARRSAGAGSAWAALLVSNLGPGPGRRASSCGGGPEGEGVVGLHGKGATEPAAVPRRQRRGSCACAKRSASAAARSYGGRPQPQLAVQTRAPARCACGKSPALRIPGKAESVFKLPSAARPPGTAESALPSAGRSESSKAPVPGGAAGAATTPAAWPWPRVPWPLEVSPGLPSERPGEGALRALRGGGRRASPPIVTPRDAGAERLRPRSGHRQIATSIPADECS
jgi:hypothetical protein